MQAGLLALTVAVAGVYALLYGAASAAETQPEAARTSAAGEAVPFCQRPFGAVEEHDIDELKAAGGLVHLLKREQAGPPFACAAFYLAHGLDVNAVGPNGLTALHYAIKANSPEMVQFVIAQGANLHKKAGARGLEPMGYAYYLALSDTATDRGRVIAILNDALIADEQ